MVFSEEIVRISLRMCECNISINDILYCLEICRTTLFNWKKKYINSSFSECLYKKYSRKTDVNQTVQKYVCEYVTNTIFLSKNKIIFAHHY